MVEKTNPEMEEIKGSFEAHLEAEDKEIADLEAQMQADLNPNSQHIEAHVDGSEKPGDTQRINGESGEEIKNTNLGTEPKEAEEAEEQEAKVEVEAEAKPEEGEAKPKVRPWSELRKTKKEKALAEQRAEQAELRARQLEERFKVLESKVAPVDPNSRPKVPEFTQDPLAHLKGATDVTQQELAQVRQMLQAQQLQAEINADENNFSKDHQDYTQARDWLLDQEYKDAQLIFRALPQEQRDQYANAMVNQRRSILIATARDTKSSVAQLAYEVAKQRGFAAKVATEVAKPNDTNLAISAADQAKAKVQNAKARDTQANSSLSSVGQTPNVKKALSRDDIMAMSEEELDKLSTEDENWMDKVQ